MASPDSTFYSGPGPSALEQGTISKCVRESTTHKVGFVKERCTQLPCQAQVSICTKQGTYMIQAQRGTKLLSPFKQKQVIICDPPKPLDFDVFCYRATDNWFRHHPLPTNRSVSLQRMFSQLR